MPRTSHTDLTDCKHGFTQWDACAMCCYNVSSQVPYLLDQIEDLKEEIKKLKAKKKEK